MRALRLSAALFVVTAGAAFSAGAPHVRLVTLDPKAVVRGTGFQAHEHLLVRLVGRGTSSKRFVANDEGGFRVTLRTPPALACGQYSLVVVRPSPAKPVRVKIGPPECAPLEGPSGPGG